MGSKKGQLFLVAVVFLIGVVFIVQQSLFQYSSVDLTRSFRDDSRDIAVSVVDLINETVKETPTCEGTKESFRNRMEEIKTSLFEETGLAYSINLEYDLDCLNWDSPPPGPAPLSVTMSVTGPGSDNSGNFDFYHEQ